MTQSTEQHKVQEETTGLSRPVLTVDWPRYAAMLEDAEISEGQKREFLEALWSIIVAFVDLGFGIHPLQQACEQNLHFEGMSAPSVESVIPSMSLPNNMDGRARPPSFVGRATEVMPKDV